MKQFFTATLLLILHLSLNLAQAQQPLSNPSSQDLIERLTPPLSHQKTRGLGRNLVPEPWSEAQRPSVDLVIEFEFDSARLIDQSKFLLNNLAIAMKSDVLARHNFSIEGHTDSIGEDGYNLRLSEQRANSVIDYLVTKGIDRNRLVGVGKGSTDPLPGEPPDSPANRRVKISLIS